MISTGCLRQKYAGRIYQIISVSFHISYNSLFGNCPSVYVKELKNLGKFLYKLKCKWENDLEETVEEFC
jgi:hypothetical protein